MLADTAARNPDGLALSDGTRRRTWAEFVDRVNRGARALRNDLGLQPDEHVALLMGNRVEGVELLLSAIHAGLWVTPINWHLTETEIAYVVADSGARVVFSDEEFGGQISGPDVVTVGEPLEALLAEASDEPMPLDGPPGGNMIYTSGTTGRPKGVKRGRPRTLEETLAGWEAYGRSIGLDGSGPHLVTGPLYHAAPLMFAVYDQASGAPVLVLPRWDEREALAWLETHEVRHAHFVPTMFVRLLRLPEEDRARFRREALELVLHGAAPIAGHVKERMIDWWGEILVEYWGGTEGGVATLVDSHAWLTHPGTVGRPVRGFEVFAVDEDQERLPPGEVGLLYSRQQDGERVFEYHDDPVKTDSAHLEDGAFTLGDIGRVDDDGFVYLVDRESSVIISGGVNVYPAEVEQLLLEHPSVLDVGVYGIPDEDWGERVCGAVELVDGVEGSADLEAELLAFARERLAGYKVPRTLRFEASLPRAPSGKLYVARLRESN